MSVGQESTITRGFLFADLRGYTDFVEQRGAAAAAALLTQYRVLAREASAQFGGMPSIRPIDTRRSSAPSASTANGDSTQQMVSMYRVDLHAADGVPDWVLVKQQDFGPPQ
jgi:class 3 adenylate cyclase